MFEFGWLLPDGTFINSSSLSHYKVVEYFTRGLRFQNLKLSITLQKKLREYDLKYGMFQSIDKFALEVLGWIKIGSSKSLQITYAGYDFQNSLVLSYRSKGYELDCLDLDEEENTELFLFDCNALDAIRNGDERSDRFGSSFKYNGTDEDDYYVNMEGKLCFPSWSRVNK